MLCWTLDLLSGEYPNGAKFPTRMHNYNYVFKDSVFWHCTSDLRVLPSAAYVPKSRQPCPTMHHQPHDARGDASVSLTSTRNPSIVSDARSGIIILSGIILTFLASGIMPGISNENNLNLIIKLILFLLQNKSDLFSSLYLRSVINKM